jgi:site-specific DNA-methyltransferase (adenine-specific)
VSMVEVVTIGDATLYLGDCHELVHELQASTIDALITDPPYAAAAATTVTGRARTTWGGNWGDMSLVLLMARQVFTARCLKPEHCAYWFCDHLTHAALVPWLFQRYHLLQTIVWDKDLLGMGGSYRKQTELILYLRTVDGPKTGMAERDLIRLRPSYSSKQHPSEKPLALMQQFVAASEWQCALDPFMGAGTTGVACALAGRKFVGIEIDKRYFDIACERIEAAYAQRRLIA